MSCVLRLPTVRMICCSKCSEWFYKDCVARSENTPVDIDKWIYVQLANGSYAYIQFPLLQVRNQMEILIWC